MPLCWRAKSSLSVSLFLFSSPFLFHFIYVFIYFYCYFTNLIKEDLKGQKVKNNNSTLKGKKRFGTTLFFLMFWIGLAVKGVQGQRLGRGHVGTSPHGPPLPLALFSWPAELYYFFFYPFHPVSPCYYNRLHRLILLHSHTNGYFFNKLTKQTNQPMGVFGHYLFIVWKKKLKGKIGLVCHFFYFYYNCNHVLLLHHHH